MTLSLRLEIKQSQKLKMNPQMQQAIALLQLTNVQLTDMLKKEMEQNPFLAFDAADYGDRQGGARGVVSQVPDLGQIEARRDSLSAHIVRQIGTLFADADERRLAVELSGWLDEGGFLRESDTDICAHFAVSSEVLSTLLTRLREIEPVGLFARNLADCFAVQLQNQGVYDAAYEVLLADMGRLGQGDLAGFAAACGVDEARLMEMIASLRALTSNPAADYEVDETLLRPPDIFVRREEVRAAVVWHAALNEETLPQVLVLERDWEAMAQRKLSDAERDFMKNNIASARWLRHAAHQRAATLLRVAEAVVVQQQRFMSEGFSGLLPLRLRDIAATLEVHESTVSRTVVGKLIATPHGVVALKDLFSVALSGAGNARVVSGAAIRARMVQLIAAEGSAVLSDAGLTAALGDEGIVLARRTVTKYRERLNIPTSGLRRRALKLKC